MKKNLGDHDRTARLFFGTISGFLFARGVLSGAAAVVLGLVSVFFLANSVLAWCPFYAVLRISTLSAADARAGEP
jgi:hypothetical protein